MDNEVTDGHGHSAICGREDGEPFRGFPAAEVTDGIEDHKSHPFGPGIRGLPHGHGCRVPGPCPFAGAELDHVVAISVVGDHGPGRVK